MESILIMPILVIAVMAVFVFGPMMTVHHAVTTAATEGSREGAKVPTTLGAADGTRIVTAVEETIEEVLGVHIAGLSITGADSGVFVIIEDSTGIECLGDTDMDGNTLACPPMTSITDPAEVQVTVAVEVDKLHVPDLLATFCLSLDGKYLTLCSLSRRDCY